ncbi:MAG TPA: hypothetical protein VFV67_16045 [Actinophytocola sp.]|nr:hypothetical protein [Actinophytocola sp.]HEU5472165.1 hypothetical protein [Actinophytocola sp.]
MEWTPEAVRAEMDYRLETARRHQAVRRLRDSGGRRPHWWQRLRTRH